MAREINLVPDIKGEMIKALKRYIIDYSNINEYDIYQIYLWKQQSKKKNMLRNFINI